MSLKGNILSDKIHRRKNQEFCQLDGIFKVYLLVKYQFTKNLYFALQVSVSIKLLLCYSNNALRKFPITQDNFEWSRGLLNGLKSNRICALRSF